MADLLRVDALDKQFSEVMVACGVDGAAKLKNEDAASLLARMVAENEKMTITTEKFPEVSVVAQWIKNAAKV